MNKLIAAFFILLAFAQPTFAQDKPFAVDQKEFLIQASSGKTLSETILIKSTSSGLVTINAKWEGYKLPKENVLSDTFLTGHSIDFASLDKTSVEIQPKSIATINLTFTIPDSIKAGDYYGSLILESSNTSEKVTFTLRILGTLTEKISVQSLDKENQVFSVQVANEGNITTKVAALVKVGDFVGEIEQLKTEPISIRAGEIKTLKIEHRFLLPGFYQSEIGIEFGNKLTRNTTVYSFWVYPWFFVLVVGVVSSIVLLFFLKRKADRAK